MVQVSNYDGSTGSETRTTGRKLMPLEVMGLHAMSIGNLIDDEAAMVWRGPMFIRP